MRFFLAKKGVGECCVNNCHLPNHQCDNIQQYESVATPPLLTSHYSKPRIPADLASLFAKCRKVRSRLDEAATQYACPDGSLRHDHLLTFVPGVPGYLPIWNPTLVLPVRPLISLSCR